MLPFLSFCFYSKGTSYAPIDIGREASDKENIDPKRLQNQTPRQSESRELFEQRQALQVSEHGRPDDPYH